MRVATEYPSPVNAPEEWALIDPVPRATFPSQLQSASRTILGTSLVRCPATFDRK